MESSITRIHFETIDSTQLYAKRELNSFHEDPKWRLITASEQIAGKGQYDRKWLSPSGNVYATFVFPLQTKHLSKILYMTQIGAVSVHQVLDELGFNADIKWKNDVRIKEKKVSGVLGESESLGESTQVLIGIGINTNFNEEDAKMVVDQPITALNLEGGKQIDVEKVIDLLQIKLYQNVEKLLNVGFGESLEYIRKHSAYVGKIVEVICKDKIFKGRYSGLNEHGFLILTDEEGQKIILNEGTMRVISN